MVITIWGNVPYAPSAYGRVLPGELETSINKYADGSWKLNLSALAKEEQKTAPKRYTLKHAPH